MQTEVSTEPRPLVKSETCGDVTVITFNHPKPQNPMSEAMGYAVRESLAQAAQDDSVVGLVLTGGDYGRDFCTGGDFNEVSAMDTPEKVESWIERTVALYIAVLEVEKPVVAALSGYAIGTGFQVALCCDWRIATSEASLIMWELEKGLACTLGGYMLEKTLGRAEMMRLVYGCEAIGGERARELGLIHDIQASFIDTAVAKARELGHFPTVPFRRTKHSINASFIQGLRDVSRVSKVAHVASFGAGAAKAHFDNVLHRN